MKNSLIILVLITSLLPSLTLAKEHKSTHHTVVKKPIKNHATKHVKKESVKHSKVKKPKVVKITNMVGIASFYGSQFHGHKTASGEIFNQNAFTAAHRTIPLQSKVKVTNLKNNKTVVVRITDRGPWVKNRIMDLSKGAAKSIGINGIQRVSLDVVG